MTMMRRTGATADGSPSTDPARVAIVGSGRMGAVHLRALIELGTPIAAIVDPVPAARAASEHAGLATFASVEQLLEARCADAVIVAAPTPFHGAVCEQLLSAGMPTLCEKPAGLTPGTTRYLAALSHSTGTPLQVGYWRRFVPSLVTLQSSIASGAFGQVTMIVSSQWDHRPPSGSFRTTSGGIAVDMGVHEFDQVRWMTGQEFGPMSWTPSGINVDPAIDGDPESGVIVSSMSQGTTALITLGRAYPVGDMCRLEVVGPDSAQLEEFLAPADGDAAFVDAVARQAAAFVAFVTEGASWPGASIDDAVAAIEAAENVGTLIGYVRQD